MTMPSWFKHWPVYTFLPFTSLMLAADSRFLAVHRFNGQLIADLLVPLYLIALIKHAEPHLRALMLLTIPLSLGGEILCSLILGLYTYKNGAIPLYVPCGHAIVFSTGFLIDRLPWVSAQHKSLQKILLLFYPLLFGFVLIFLHDTLTILFGTLYFLLLWRKNWAPFYLIMGLVVLFVEMVGTHFGCWSWQPQPFGVFQAANPPPGAVVFYIFGDILVLRTFKGFKRLKSKVDYRRVA